MTSTQAALEHEVELLHGVKVHDPYRWLEDQESQRTRAWLSTQAEQTRAYFGGIPARGRIRKRVEELLQVTNYREPREVGDRCFYLKREPLREQPRLCVLERNSNQEITLLDPAETKSSPNRAIDVLAISSTGKYVAFLSMDDGRDCAAVGFIDVDEQRVLEDKLPAGVLGGMVISEANNGFYYVHAPLNPSQPVPQRVMWHRFGSSFATDEVLFDAGAGANERLIIAAAAPPRFVFRLVHFGDPLRSDFYFHDITQGASARRFLTDIEGVFEPFFAASGSRLLAFTDHLAPNRRIVEIELEEPAPEKWSNVIPEGNLQVEQWALAGDALCLVLLENFCHKVVSYDLTGNIKAPVPCPPGGTVQFVAPSAASTSLYYQFSSITQPPIIFRYDPATAKHEPWAFDLPLADLSTIEQETVFYPGKDGMAIPMEIIRRNGPGFGKPGPVLLSAYGGFGFSMTPRFTAHVQLLLELGCVIAVAHVRGGAEFGKQWHEAARRRKRQTAIDDFLSAAEWLLATKIAEPGRLAIAGGSNAGLLVGAAMTQRPELFRAVICLGPLLDMLRYHKFDFANYWVEEYGCADLEEDFHALLGYSPYHHVQEGTPYPAVLLVSGDADTRCNPLHARKMAARLQGSTSSARPVLLDYRQSWGHVPVQPLTRRIDALTDRISFLYHELELLLPERWA